MWREQEKEQDTVGVMDVPFVFCLRGLCASLCGIGMVFAWDLHWVCVRLAFH